MHLQAILALEAHESVRVLVVCGQGRNFCSGVDVGLISSMTLQMVQGSKCPARQRERLRQQLFKLQVAIGMCCCTMSTLSAHLYMSACSCLHCAAPTHVLHQ
jgi:hypothetical protein